MKEYMEFSAKTVDEAITKALLELEISSDRLKYEVIEKGSSGILGMFTRPAVIRVVKPSQNEDEYLLEEPEDSTEAVSAALEKESLSSEKEKSVKESPAKEKPVKENFTKEKPAKESSITENISAMDRERSRETAKAPAREGNREHKKPAREYNRNSSGSTKPAKEKEGKPAVSKPMILVKPDDEETLQLLNKVEKFLKDMFAAMSMEVNIETGYDPEEKTILVNLSGEDMGVLIGKRGQTLDSIQYLSSLVVNKGEEEYVRVKVDTENYRERRKETLETLARNISFKVKRSKRPVSLEPMNPYERRVIHAALQNDKYVVTRSEGVEPYRHIVISPKNTRYGARK